MKFFLWNLLLALTWAVATGSFTLSNVVIGIVLGYFILMFSQRALGTSPYLRKVPQVARFAGFYLWQIILSNLRVAYDIVTPKHYMKPGVIAIPLDAKTDGEITLLANLITLTPGTLTLDISADRRVLFIHTMYMVEDDVEKTREEIKSGLERRVLQVLR